MANWWDSLAVPDSAFPKPAPSLPTPSQGAGTPSTPLLPAPPASNDLLASLRAGRDSQIAAMQQAASAPTPSLPTPPQPKPGFDLGNVGSALWEGATQQLLPGLKSAAAQAYTGINPVEPGSLAERWMAEGRQAQEQSNARLEELRRTGQTDSSSEAIREAMPSLGFSLVNMAGSLPAGLLAGAAGTAAGGPVAGGMAGSAAAGSVGAALGYRMAGSQLLNDSLAEMEKESQTQRGRGLSAEERNRAVEALTPIAQDTGLWEAGPEFVGNAMMFGLGRVALGFLPKQSMAKLAQTALGRAGVRAAAGAGALGTEIGTEGITQFNQGPNQQRADAATQAILDGKDPQAAIAAVEPMYQGVEGLWQATKDVAPATVATVLMMGGIAKPVHMAGAAIENRRAGNARVDQAEQDTAALRANLDVANEQDIAQALSGFDQLETQGLPKHAAVRLEQARQQLTRELELRASPESLAEPLETARGRAGYLGLAERADSLSDEQLLQAASRPLPQDVAPEIAKAHKIYGAELAKRQKIAQVVDQLQDPDAAKIMSSTLGRITSGKPLAQGGYGSRDFNLASLSDDMLERYRLAADVLGQSNTASRSVQTARDALNQEAERRASGQRRDPESIRLSETASKVALAPEAKMAAMLKGLSTEGLDRIAGRLNELATANPLLADRARTVLEQVRQARMQQFNPSGTQQAGITAAMQGWNQDQGQPAQPAPGLPVPAEQGQQPPITPNIPNPAATGQPMLADALQRQQALKQEVAGLNQQPTPSLPAPPQWGGPLGTTELQTQAAPTVGPAFAPQPLSGPAELTRLLGTNPPAPTLPTPAPPQGPTSLADLLGRDSRLDVVPPSVSAQGAVAPPAPTPRLPSLPNVQGRQTVQQAQAAPPVVVPTGPEGARGARAEGTGTAPRTAAGTVVPQDLASAVRGGPTGRESIPTTATPSQPETTREKGQTEAEAAPLLNQEQAPLPLNSGRQFRKIKGFARRAIRRVEQTLEARDNYGNVARYDIVRLSNDTSGRVKVSYQLFPHGSNVASVTDAPSREALLAHLPKAGLTLTRQSEVAEAKPSQPTKDQEAPASTGAGNDATQQPKPGWSGDRMVGDDRMSAQEKATLAKQERDRLIAERRRLLGRKAAADVAVPVKWAVDAAKSIKTQNVQEISRQIEAIEKYALKLLPKYDNATGEPISYTEKQKKDLVEKGVLPSQEPSASTGAVKSDKPTAPTQKVVTAAGTEIDVRFEVVELSSLITSDSPRFPKELQPRDRSRIASAEQVSSMAAKLDPMQLADSRLASDGAPIVGTDNVVESGNGRTLALREVYAKGRLKEKAAAYRAMLADRGFDSPGMKEPVLIRRRVTDMTPAQRKTFTEEANARNIMGMSPAERALVHAGRLTPGLLDLYRGGDLTTLANGDFVRGFMAEVAMNESAEMMDAGGRLNQEGIRRIESAILARAYPDADLLGTLLESTDNNIKAIGGALLDSAPGMVQLKSRIEKGLSPAELDITQPIVEAAQLVAKARRENLSISDLLSQSDMFGGGINPTAKRIVRLFFSDSDLKRQVSRDKIGYILNTYASQAKAIQRGDPLFQDAPTPTVGDLLNALEDRSRATPGQQQPSLLGGNPTGASRRPGGPEIQRPGHEPARAPAGKPESGESRSTHEGKVEENNLGSSFDDRGKDDEIRDSRRKRPVQANQTGDLFASAPVPDQLDILAPTQERASAQAQRVSVNLGQRVDNVQSGEFASALGIVKTPSDAANVLLPLAEEAQEHMMALVTDQDGKVLSVVRHTIGQTDSSSVEYGILLGAVHATPGAAHVWFAHNHPSGNIEQSTADLRVTKALTDALDGTGVMSEGMIVITSNGKASYFDPRTGASSSTPVAIADPNAERIHRVPVTTRKIRSTTQEASITSANEMMMALKRFSNGQEGVLLMDNSNRPVIFVPMTGEEMNTLRQGDRASALFRAIHEGNAKAVAVVVKDETPTSIDGVNNIVAFASNLNLRYLDAMKIGGFSTFQQKGIDTDYNRPNVYNSRPSTATTKPATVAQARASLVKALGEKHVTALERAGRLMLHEKDPTKTGAAGYVDGKGVIHLIPANMDQTALDVALHEAMHLARDDRFSEGERAKVRLAHAALRLVGLKNFVGNPGFNDLVQQVRRMAAEGNKTAQDALAKARLEDPNNIDEEAIAYLAQYADEKLPLVRRVLAAIRAALYRMGIKVNLTPADVRALALSALKAQARAANREMMTARRATTPAFSLPDFAPTEADKAEVERQMAAVKEVRDAQGRLLAPNGQPSKLNERQWKQVRTQFFKDWFGDFENDPANASKVVDENGEPLVVYHGSTSDIFEFRGGDFGIHFGTIDAAESRLMTTADGAGTNYPVFLNIRHPIRTNDLRNFIVPNEWLNESYWFRERWPKSLADSALDVASSFEKAIAPLREEYQRTKDRVRQKTLLDETLRVGADFVDAMKKALSNHGIDGIVYLNLYEGYHDSFMALSPNQIKSALGNAGTFSPRSNRIDYSLPTTEDDAAEQDRLWAEFQAVRAQFQARQPSETAFKRWFGKGTEGITARNGQPITLYHGTNNPEFNRWDESRSGQASDHPTSGLGFFMTADRRAAKRYGSRVLELHARINKPYYMTDADLTSIETVQDAKRFRRKLLAHGYDGAVVSAPGGAPYVIVFNSNQAKFINNLNPSDSDDFRFSKPLAGGNPSSSKKSGQSSRPDSDVMSGIGGGISVRDQSNHGVNIPPRASGVSGRMTDATQKRMDRVEMYANFFGNEVTRNTIINQGFDSLDIKNKRAVMSRMLAPLHDRKILRSIVETIPIDMMNNLIGGKRNPDDVFNNPAMLLDRLSIKADGPVPFSVRRIIEFLAETHPRIVTLLRTEFGSSDPRVTNLEFGAAMGTMDNGHGIAPSRRAVSSGADVGASVPRTLSKKVKEYQDIRYSRPGRPSLAHPREAAKVLGDIGELRDTLKPGEKLLAKLNPANWRQMLSDLKANTRPQWLGLLTQDHLLELARKHLPSGAVRQFDDASERMEAYENRMIQAEGFPLADRWQTLMRNNRAQADALGRALHMSTWLGVDPRQPSAPKGKQVEWVRAKAALSALTNPEARKLYDDVLGFYANQTKRLFEELEQRIQRHSLPDPDKRAARDLLRQEFERMKQEGPYVPLMRFGDLTVWAEPRNPGEKPVFATLETVQDQRAFADWLKSQGYQPRLGVKMDEITKRALPAGDMVGKLTGIIDKNLKGPQADAIKDAMYQLFLRSLPEQAIRKHFLHRKFVPGYSADAIRTFATFARRSAKQVARLAHGDRMGGALDEMAKAVRDGTVNDPVAAGHLVNELDKSYQWSMDPQTADWASRLTHLGFMWHLGASPAHLLLNLGQQAQLTLPWLAGELHDKKGFAAVAAALGKANLDFLRTNPFTDPAKRGASAKTLRARLEGEYGGDLGRALKALEEAGKTDKSQTYSISGMSSEDQFLWSRPWLRKITQGAAWFFHTAEVINREASAIAAYRLGRESGMGHEAAYDLARRAINETHYDYSPGNRSRFMRGNVAKVITLFKQYALNTSWQLARNAYLSARGATPAEKAVARTKLRGMLGMTALMAGAVGMPFYNELAWMLTQLMTAFGDDDEPEWDFDTWFRRTLDDALNPTASEAARRGLVNAFVGIDLSSRVKLDDLWWRRTEDDQHGRQVAYAMLEQALGPVAGLAVRGISTVDGLWDALIEGTSARGASTRTLAEAMPKALKDISKTWRFATEGATTASGAPLMSREELGAGAIVGQAIGFRPAALTERQSANTAMLNLQDRIKRRRTAILDTLNMAVWQGDGEVIGALQSDIAAFNKRYPAMAITGDTIQNSIEAGARRRLELQLFGGAPLDRRLAPMLLSGEREE